MDKTVLITALVVSLAGIVALNIQHIFNFISEHLMNALFYSIKIDDASPFYYAMQRYVKNEQSKRIKNYYYKNFWDNWVQGTDGQDKIKKNDNLFFSYGYFVVNHEGSRVFLTKINETLTNTIDPWKNVKQSIRLYGFSKSSVFKLLDHVEKNYYRNTINYYFNSDGEIKLLGPVSNKRFDHIFLNDNLTQKIKWDVDRFNSSKEKYESLGIKYKRTYLFYGPAGTGKSSLATAIANHTHRNILSINISKDITDSTLIKLVAMRPEKAIILFEDIDCLFDNLNREKGEDEKDEKSKIKITLSCILNILDGAYTPDDVIFILTTNHIDKLDDAIKRDGRADMKLEITKPNTETKQRYLDYVKEQTGQTITTDLTEDVTLSTLEKFLLQ
jgi:ATP-dependent Zn protease